MIPAEILYGLLGLLLGLVLCFVLLQGKRRSLESELTAEREEKEAIAKTLQMEREKGA